MRNKSDNPIKGFVQYLAFSTFSVKVSCSNRNDMFIATLFTVARSQKQPKCPSTDEWIKKMWYIYTMEYYSAIKRKQIRSFTETWMDLETVIQSEVCQKEKNKYHMLMHICGT